MDSRSKNGTRNIVAGLLNRLVLIALPFIARTVIIYILGSSYLGLNSLFSSILMVLNLSELGIGSALVYSMYKPVAGNDKVKLCALLAVYKKIYRLIGIGVLVLGLLFTPFLRDIIKGEIPNDINIYILYLVYLFNTSVSYFAYAHKKALLIAYQRSDILSNVNTAIAVGTNILQIVLLVITHDYYFYVCVFPIFTIAENLWAGYISKKRYPDIEPKGSIDKMDQEAIKQHTKGIALQQLCSTSRNSLDSIVISMFLGLTAIAIYSNYFYIMISIHVFLYQVPNSIRAIVGNSVASETLEKNYRDFGSMYLIYMWISGWCAVCLFLLYQPFMELWVGKDLMFPLSTVILFCLYFILLSLSDIIALYKDAAGLWWHGRYRVIIEAVANLILNFLLGYYWGVEGILWATIITMAILGHGYGGWIVFHYYFKDKSFIAFIAKQISYILIIGIVSYITYVIAQSFEGDIVYRLAVCIGLCIFLPNILFFVLFRIFPEYNDAVYFLKGLISNARNKSIKDV